MTVTPEPDARLDAAIDAAANELTRVDNAADTVPHVMTRIASAGRPATRRAGWQFIPAQLAACGVAAALLIAAVVVWRPWQAAPTSRLPGTPVLTRQDVRPPGVTPRTPVEQVNGTSVLTSAARVETGRIQTERVRPRRASARTLELEPPTFALLPTDALTLPPARDPTPIATEIVEIETLAIPLLTLDALPAPSPVDPKR